MANTIIQGVNYKKVVVVGIGNQWDIVPFDFGGKALTEMTIVVDSTFAIGTLFLPEIISSATPPAYSFGGVYGTTIKVIAPTGATNDVVINTSFSDTIGSASSVTLSTDGASAIFTIVSDTNWSVLKTS